MLFKFLVLVISVCFLGVVSVGWCCVPCLGLLTDWVPAGHRSIPLQGPTPTVYVILEMSFDSFRIWSLAKFGDKFRYFQFFVLGKSESS